MTRAFVLASPPMRSGSTCVSAAAAASARRPSSWARMMLARSATALAHRGERDAVGAADEQRHAELALETPDRVADRRLRHQQLLGRARHAAGERDGMEGAELREGHGLMLARRAAAWTKPGHHRVRAPGLRAHLRHEQRRHVERVIVELEDAGSPSASAAVMRSPPSSSSSR